MISGIKKLYLCIILTTVTLMLGSWGFLVHRTVAQLAVYKLPEPMRGFFHKHMDYLVKHSVRPDLRRNEDSTEAPKHYIDLEAFGDSAAWKLPYTWEEAAGRFSADTFIRYGYAPYHILRLQKNLTLAFRRGNSDSILFYAADISHYLGDINVPLHTTLNYDGQLTNQKGLHNLWESAIPELELENYNLYNRHRAVYLSHPGERVWQTIRKSFGLLKDLFMMEKEVSGIFPDSLKYNVQKRSGREIKSYSPAFARAYALRLKSTVNGQLRNSADLIADFWFTAWVDAGKPGLTSPVSSPVESENKKELRKEMKAYRKNNLIEKKLLRSKQEKTGSGS